MSRFQQFKTIFEAIERVRSRLTGDVYLVGGAVRDMLTSVNSHDLDFVVIGADYQAYARAIAKELHSHTVLFKDNIRIPCNGGYIDISAPRGATIEEDLHRRDFTINNLALSMNGEIIGDKSDLNKKRIVPVYNRVFDDDPVRILRGFRQAASLGFILSDAFLELAREKIPLLPTVAGERIYEELKKFSNATCATPLLYQQAEEAGLWQALTGKNPDRDKLFRLYSLNGIYREAFTEDERLTLFLAVLFAEGNSKETEKLHPSKQVQRSYTDILTKAKPFMAEAAQNPSHAAWRYRKLMPLLLPFVTHYYNFKPNAVLEAIRQIAAYEGYMADGATMREAINKIAPDMREGRWIADIMDECNFRLTFGLLQDRGEATTFIEGKIHELRPF